MNKQILFSLLFLISNLYCIDNPVSTYSYKHDRDSCKFLTKEDHSFTPRGQFVRAQELINSKSNYFDAVERYKNLKRADALKRDALRGGYAPAVLEDVEKDSVIKNLIPEDLKKLRTLAEQLITNPYDITMITVLAIKNIVSNPYDYSYITHLEEASHNHNRTAQQFLLAMLDTDYLKGKYRRKQLRELRWAVRNQKEKNQKFMDFFK